MTRCIISIFCLALAGLAISPSAHAVIYIGNPHVTFTIDRAEGDLDEAEVTIEKVRIHGCNGAGYTDYAVDETVDLYQGWGMDFPTGNYCAMKLFLDSDLLVDGVDSNANSFTIAFDGALIHIPTAVSSSTVTLSNVEWIVGTISGSNPQLTASFTQ